MSTRFVISADVCSATDKDGSTILNVRHGMLYSAIGLASDIWTKLANQSKGLSSDEIDAQIIRDYPDVETDRIQCDVERLLQQFSQKQLIMESTMSHTINRRKGFRLHLARLFVPRCIATILNLRLFAVAAAFQLFFFDLILHWGGFRLVHEILTNWPRNKEESPYALPKLSQALTCAAKYYPKHVLCVQRSAALTGLLRCAGVPAQTVIACRKVPFKGHAWVEVGGEVINDNPKVQSFYNNVLTRC